MIPIDSQISYNESNVLTARSSFRNRARSNQYYKMMDTASHARSSWTISARNLLNAHQGEDPTTVPVTPNKTEPLTVNTGSTNRANRSRPKLQRSVTFAPGTVMHERTTASVTRKPRRRGVRRNHTSPMEVVRIEL